MIVQRAHACIFIAFILCALVHPTSLQGADPKQPEGSAQYEAIRLTPGTVHGGGPRLIAGWEFTSGTAVLVHALGIYDHDRDGLVEEHAVALWNVSSKKMIASISIGPDSEAKLSGHFRYVAVAATKLEANQRYALVAHYPSVRDSTVTAADSQGPILEFASPLRVTGRRYVFPRDKMDFPSGFGEGVKFATIGPTLVFSLVAGQDNDTRESASPSDLVPRSEPEESNADEPMEMAKKSPSCSDSSPSASVGSSCSGTRSTRVARRLRRGKRCCHRR